jgi:hypothetical protein
LLFYVLLSFHLPFHIFNTLRRGEKIAVCFLPERTVSSSCATDTEFDDVIVMLLLVSWGSYSGRALGLGLLVEVLMSMAEWDGNRFWDRTSWIRVIPEQTTNQVNPKQ